MKALIASFQQTTPQSWAAEQNLGYFPTDLNHDQADS
jgi:hypothetical protein